MSLDQIQKAVLEVLREVQEISGRPWKALPATARPIGDLEGFDSLCSVEATVMVEEKLGCGELKAHSFFVSEDGALALSVQETTKRIQKLIAASKEKE